MTQAQISNRDALPIVMLPMAVNGLQPTKPRPSMPLALHATSINKDHLNMNMQAQKGTVPNAMIPMEQTMLTYYARTCPTTAPPVINRMMSYHVAIQN